MKTTPLSLLSLALTLATAPCAQAQKRDIVDTAVKAGTFKTLATALTKAGLVEALKGKGPFTVFAPTDAAFRKLPEGTVETLLKPENRAKLVRILTYHVVAGRVDAVDAIQARQAKTLAKEKVRIRLVDGVLRINDARVVKNDIRANNGIIHVIDSVLLPPNKPATPREAARDLISRAIDAGVPIYNSGEDKACEVIYEITARSLVGLAKKELSGSTFRKLETALQSKKGQTANQRAWDLRRALDTAYAELEKPARRHSSKGDGDRRSWRARGVRARNSRNNKH